MHSYVVIKSFTRSVEENNVIVAHYNSMLNKKKTPESLQYLLRSR